eukprot:1963635-Pleurochrysis_carterae.AAC.4
MPRFGAYLMLEVYDEVGNVNLKEMSGNDAESTPSRSGLVVRLTKDSRVLTDGFLRLRALECGGCRCEHVLGALQRLAVDADGIPLHPPAARVWSKRAQGAHAHRTHAHGAHAHGAHAHGVHDQCSHTGNTEQVFDRSMCAEGNCSYAAEATAVVAEAGSYLASSTRRVLKSSSRGWGILRNFGSSAHRVCFTHSARLDRACSAGALILGALVLMGSCLLRWHKGAARSRR